MIRLFEVLLYLAAHFIMGITVPRHNYNHVLLVCPEHWSIQNFFCEVRGFCI